MTDETPESLAERIVIGAALLDSAVGDAIAETIDAGHFADPHHGEIWAAIRAVRGRDEPSDPEPVMSQLGDRLVRVGGAPYLHTCVTSVPGRIPSTADATYYAGRVADHAAERLQRGHAERHRQILLIPDPDARNAGLTALIADMAAGLRGPGAAGTEGRSLFYDGGSFVLDVPDIAPAVWGDGKDVLWAQGEALMICGPSGVGKTTIALQLLRARLGLQHKVLGCSVAQTDGRILYLAMDRPAQFQRAARRIFTEDDRELLNARLTVWKGPPPQDLAAHPQTLARMCADADADTVFVDSVKDAAVGISKDEVGAGYNRARQNALAAGIEVLELHHLRKASADNKQPSTLDDIYGSTWLTAGAGSVVLLWGEPGDPVVSWRHVKQPEAEVGPFQVAHDHESGTSEVELGLDLVALVSRCGVRGLTALDFAVQLFGVTRPSPAQKKKAMRQLDKKVDEGVLSRMDGASGGDPSKYYLRQP